MEDNVPNPQQIAKTEKEIEEMLKGNFAVSSPTPEPESPIPAESDHPTSAETPTLEADENAKVQSAQGSTVPMPSNRPQPPSKVQEQGNVIVAKELSGQLGTSPELKAQMRIDERKMGVLDDGTLAALSHFSYRYVYDKVRYWGHITEWWLTGSQGIGGLGRRHILQALANTSGVQSVETAKKPNPLARNLWDRDWKQKAEAEGKIVDE